MPKMDDSQLKSICEAKLNNALGWLGGRLSEDRILAQRYYRGDAFGNEQDGRSKVVSRDVAEAIDTALPGVLKPFVSSDTVVLCTPRRPEDEEVAKQATDYLNWVFQSQPNAFNLIQTWVKSGLMYKYGTVKSWWDEQDTAVVEEYEGLTRFQYLSLIAEENVEEVKCTTRPATPAQPDPDAEAAPPTMVDGTPEQGPVPPLPQPMGLIQPAPALNPGALPRVPANFPGGVTPPLSAAPAAAPASQNPLLLDDGLAYDCTIKRSNKTGRIMIAAVPPEEFLTDRRAVTLEDATFCAHRFRRHVSDLIEMGYPRKIVESLPGSDELDFNMEKIERFKPEDEEPRRDADDLDPAMRWVWYAECFLKIDYDGDGIAEWRKVVLAGGGGYEILENELCDGHPFSGWCPYPQPHKLYGESMADKTMDLQLIKSTVWRQTLDELYFNNAPQLVVLEGQANLEDVLTRRPGGVIRIKSPGAVQPLPSQDVSASGFTMISYLDSVREARTGIRRFTAGIQADALNPYASTATGAAMVQDSSQDQIMLLARNFAEQGLVPLFQRMLELTCKHQDKAQEIRLRGEWVNIDPSAWSTKMDFAVAVGLGTGNRSQQVGQLMGMLTQVDGPIVQLQGGLNGPLITAENAFRKLTKLAEAMGFKESDGFYSDPAEHGPPPPPTPPPAASQPQPDPGAAIANAKLATTQTKAQADIARGDRKAAHDATLAQAEAGFKAQLAAQKAQHAALLAQQKQAHEMQLERFRAGAAVSLAREKAQSAAAAKVAGELAGDVAGAPAVVISAPGERR